jgi:hypothetical protein
MDALGSDWSEVEDQLAIVLKRITKRNQPTFIMKILEGLNIEISQSDLIQIINQAAEYAY